MSSILQTAQSRGSIPGVPKKATNRVLRLDASGREIDERGLAVKQDLQHKTLAANVSESHEKKKKDNPYLAHRTASAEVVVQPQSSQAKAAASSLPAALPGVLLAAHVPSEKSDNNDTKYTGEDSRLHIRNRDNRAKKSFQFVEEGLLFDAINMYTPFVCVLLCCLLTSPHLLCVLCT